jgi:hypothetical protein
MRKKQITKEKIRIPRFTLFFFNKQYTPIIIATVRQITTTTTTIITTGTTNVAPFAFGLSEDLLSPLFVQLFGFEHNLSEVG